MSIFPFGLAVCVLTLAYFCVSERVVGRKYEYVKFTLLALSLWWLLSLVYHVAAPSAKVGFFSAMTLLPMLAVVHQLYPFRASRRNRTVSFLLWGAVAIGLVVACGACLLVGLAGM